MNRHGALNGAASGQGVGRQGLLALVHLGRPLETRSTSGRDVPRIQSLGGFKPRPRNLRTNVQWLFQEPTIYKAYIRPI